MSIYVFAILGYIVLFLTAIVLIRSLFSFFRKKFTSRDNN